VLATNDFVKTYEGCMGSRLVAVAFRPITCDTSVVIEQRRNSSTEFSGAVSIHFDGGKEIFLTWRTGLESSSYLAIDTPDWAQFSLDLVHVTDAPPWGELVGGRLAQATLHTHSTLLGQNAAIRHVIDLGNRALSFWVGVGKAGRVEESDDLITCLGDGPSNLEELTAIACLSSR
jgi:hypothetical protein